METVQRRGVSGDQRLSSRVFIVYELVLKQLQSLGLSFNVEAFSFNGKFFRYAMYVWGNTSHI